MRDKLSDTVVELLGNTGVKDLFPVGRLDKDSEGLILLTNDGDLTEKLLRGRYGHEKEYVVSVNKPLTVTKICDIL